MKKKDFERIILTDEYISWLEEFSNKYNCFDTMYFVHYYKNVLPERDIKYIFLLEDFYQELEIYFKQSSRGLLKNNNQVFELENNGECYSCKKVEPTNEETLDYSKFKKKYLKNMNLNFDFLEERVFDSLEKSDLEKIKYVLSNINGNTLISGVGGSSVVAEYLKRVLEEKNKILCERIQPRDFLYKNLANYSNVIATSYGGKNYGVDISFQNDLNKYLFSHSEREGITPIKYDFSFPNERSFISLAATLIPMSILLYYYSNSKQLVKDILSKTKELTNIKAKDIYEVFSGYESSTATRYLESTMTESGIAIPIIHDKYDYCHGRSTTTYNNSENGIIYFDNNKKLDNIILEEFKNYKNEVIVFKSKYEDSIIDDYYLTYSSMLLTKTLASNKNKDLSDVDYAPIVKKLYLYKGDM